MTGEIPSLWPATLQEASIVTPKSILRRQAEVISEMTTGRVLGEVHTKVLGRELTHTFGLVIPGLEGYRHFVLRIRHYLDAPYPLRMFNSETDDTFHEAPDELEFMRALKGHLNSDRILGVIRALLVQAD